MKAEEFCQNKTGWEPGKALADVRAGLFLASRKTRLQPAQVASQGWFWLNDPASHQVPKAQTQEGLTESLREARVL